MKLSGFVILFIGVATLLFTFLNAYQLLMGFEDVLGSPDLINLFGEALAPLISYAIRALYLGIMGWIGSILTRRGVQILTTVPIIPNPSNPKDEASIEYNVEKKRDNIAEETKKGRGKKSKT